MKFKALVAGFALAAVAGSAMATTTNPAAPVVGTLPSTGGSEDVTLTINDIVHISGLSTIALGTYSGNSLPKSASDNFCVYRNGTGNYKLTIASANASGTQLRLYDGTNYINYTLDYTDASGTSTNIGTVTASSRAAGGVATNATCVGHTADNGTMTATVTATDLDAAQPGIYTDTLNLTVTAY